MYRDRVKFGVSCPLWRLIPESAWLTHWLTVAIARNKQQPIESVKESGGQLQNRPGPRGLSNLLALVIQALLLPIDEAIASRAVIAIVFGSDDWRTERLFLEPAKFLKSGQR